MAVRCASRGPSPRHVRALCGINQFFLKSFAVMSHTCVGDAIKYALSLDFA